MNIVVVNDYNWDNFAIVSKRLNTQYIDPMHRINYFYGKHMESISNICNQNMLHLIRQPLFKDKICNILKESLRTVKFCIIFHNFLEYNTISSLYINICNKNFIPYFIFSEHCNNFYFNGKITNEKFKTCIRQIETVPDRILNIEIPFEIEFIKEKTCPKNIQDVINNIRTKYKLLQNDKKSRQVVYDEDIVKERKQILKSKKELSYIKYMENKKKWIKEIIPKH